MSLLYPFLLCIMAFLAVSCGPIVDSETNNKRIVRDYLSTMGTHSFSEEGELWMGMGSSDDLWCAGHSSTGEERNDSNTVGDKRDAPAWSNY